MTFPPAPHERTAMRHLLLNARAFAQTLPAGEAHAVKLRVWAQIVEDMLERMEKETQRA